MSNHVEQPTAQTFKTGDITLKVEFRPNFSNDWNGRFGKAQKMFDMECLRLCNQSYVPFLTGNNLCASGMRASKIGEGLLVWDAPMAGHLYHNPQFHFTKIHPRAGGNWGQRMKADYLTHLKQFAATVLKGQT